MLDPLDLFDLLALLPLFDHLALLALFAPLDLHVRALKVCLPLGRLLCVYTLLVTCRNFITI